MSAPLASGGGRGGPAPFFLVLFFASAPAVVLLLTSEGPACDSAPSAKPECDDEALGAGVKAAKERSRPRRPRLLRRSLGMNEQDGCTGVDCAPASNGLSTVFRRKVRRRRSRREFQYCFARMQRTGSTNTPMPAQISASSLVPPLPTADPSSLRAGTGGLAGDGADGAACWGGCCGGTGGSCGGANGAGLSGGDAGNGGGGEGVGSVGGGGS